MDKCEISPADDVSTALRKRDESEHSFQLDGWVRWDMPGDFTEYYDLTEEYERYTEYQVRCIALVVPEECRRLFTGTRTVACEGVPSGVLAVPTWSAFASLH